MTCVRAAFRGRIISTATDALTTCSPVRSRSFRLSVVPAAHCPVFRCRIKRRLHLYLSPQAAAINAHTVSKALIRDIVKSGTSASSTTLIATCTFATDANDPLPGRVRTPDTNLAAAKVDPEARNRSPPHTGRVCILAFADDCKHKRRERRGSEPTASLFSKGMRQPLPSILFSAAPVSP